MDKQTQFPEFDKEKSPDNTELIPGGYVLQPRCIDESWIANAAPATREVWGYLCRNVNWKSSRTCERGEGWFTYATLINALSWNVGARIERYSEEQIKVALRKLTENHAITKTKTGKGIRVKVLNYGVYQDPNSYEDRTKTGREPDENLTISKEGRREEGKKRRVRFIKPTLSEWVAYAKEIEYPAAEAERLFDYYVSNGWKQKGGNSLIDWKSACRNGKRRASGNSGNPDGIDYNKPF